MLRDRLAQAMNRAKRNNTFMALMFLDLHHFKDINDSSRHWAGNLILKEVSKRIKNCLREGDIIARLGSGELTIILEDMSDKEDVATGTGRFWRPSPVLSAWMTARCI